MTSIWDGAIGSIVAGFVTAGAVLFIGTRDKRSRESLHPTVLCLA